MTDLSARPLHNKVAWVTGASRGIGAAVARTLAKAGATVVAGARSADALENLVESITSNGGKAEALELDVSRWDSCQAFADAAAAKHGNVDLLVNNAGMGIFRPIHNMDPEEFEVQFRVNVFGTFYMTRLAVPRMKEQGGGHIVNVSSLAGENAAPMGSGYFATKWAVNGFTQCVFQDVRDDNIKVTLVCPGSVDTRFHLDSHPGSHPKDQTWMVTPADVAQSVLHVVTMPAAALVSKIDVRPQMKPKR